MIVGLILLPFYGQRVLSLPLFVNILRMQGACIVAALLSIAIAVLAMRVIGPGSLASQAAMGLVWASAMMLPATWIMLGRDQRSWLYARLQRRR